MSDRTLDAVGTAICCLVVLAAALVLLGAMLDLIGGL